jgi:hypothetical protein
MSLQTLTSSEEEIITGGNLGHIAIAIAILDASYDFYQGFRDHRR